MKKYNLKKKYENIKYIDFVLVLEALPSKIIVAYYPSVKFFQRHPGSFNIIVENIGKPISWIANMLFNNGVSNKGNPISLVSVYKHVKAVKSILEIIELDENEGYPSLIVNNLGPVERGAAVKLLTLTDGKKWIKPLEGRGKEGPEDGKSVESHSMYTFKVSPPNLCIGGGSYFSHHPLGNKRLGGGNGTSMLIGLAFFKKYTLSNIAYKTFATSSKNRTQNFLTDVNKDSNVKMRYNSKNLQTYVVRLNELPEELKKFIELLEFKKKYMFFFKVKLEAGYWISLSRQLFFEADEKLFDNLMSIIVLWLEVRRNNYEIPEYLYLNITYCIVTGGESPSVQPIYNVTSEGVNVQYIFNNKPKLKLSAAAVKVSKLKGEFLNKKYVPSAIDKLGVVISKDGNLTRYQHPQNRDIIIEAIRIDDKVQKYNLFLNGVLIMAYKDEIEVDFSWRRILNNLTIYYNKEGRIYKYESLIQCRYLKKENISKKINDKYLTMDIETYIFNNEHIPYCIGWYDGEETHTYHISDYGDWGGMVEKVFEDLTISKYNRYTIYMHNMAKFDSAFLIKILMERYKITPTIKDGKIISFTLTTKQPEMVSEVGVKKIPNITLHIKDSYLLIPTSLKEAAISFNVLSKGIFPYKFVNEDTLNYVGATPPYTYYESQISQQHYECIIQEDWSCREESLKYLENDLITLYEILVEFSKEIYNQFKLNITKYSTISALAFKIYLSNYMDTGVNIPIITGIHNKNQSNAYYGGMLELYEPFLTNGYSYDVNSLYPSQMTKPMPVGSPRLTSEPNLDKIFGICHVKITTPPDIEKPILPFRDDKGRIYYPRGTWTGWYVSEELKNAKLYGYKVELIESYHYEKSSIFMTYVNKIFSIKERAEGALYQIAKLLLNSLSGRLALKENNTITEFLDQKRFEDILKTHNVYDFLDLDNNSYLVKYDIEPNIELCNKFNMDYPNLIKIKDNFKSSRSIAIPAFITAYGRMFMSQYIQDSVYIDTDGICTTKELDKTEIDKTKIGKFKLENEILLGYFLAPKLYYIFSPTGKNICKAAGVGKLLTRTDYKLLYNGELIAKNKEKWKYNLEKGTIKLLSSTTTLSINVHKRLHIIINGVWVGTSPREVYNNKLSPLSLIIRPSFPIQIYKHKST